MTVHGPEAIRLVREAYTAANLDVPAGRSTAVTGLALDVIKGRLTREAAIDVIVYRFDVAPNTAAKYLDLAVEALTAQEK